MLKNITTALSLLFISGIMSAQDEDSEFKKAAETNIKAQFPSTRVLNFEYGQSLSRDFDSKLFDEDFQEGEIENQKTLKASANIPIYRTRKWTLTGSGNYTFTAFDYKDNFATSENAVTTEFHNFSAALSSTYFSSLFNKPVIYNASLIVDGNDEGLERVKGLIGASFILKRTERTTLTLGAIIIVDPTAQIPFFPVFTYNHKFKNSKWEFDFILPQRVLFRRMVADKGRFSIGSTFGSSGFYVNVDNSEFADVYEYSQLEVNTGIIYEHLLAPGLIGTVKGGLTNFISSRLTEKGEPTKDFIYENSQDATGYFNIGISFDPFLKKKKADK